MASITGVQITGLGDAVVSFDAAVSAEEMSSGQHWDLSPVSSAAASSSVYDAEALGGQLVRVWFSPPLSPTQAYTITAYPGGVATSYVYSAPNVAKELGDEWLHGALRAISRTCGQMVQELTGRPETILLKDIRPGDSHVFVESTLGFPDSGYFHVGDRLFRYQSRLPASFRGCTVDEQISVVISARQRVSVDTARILPRGSRPHLDASGDGTDGVI